MIRVGGAISGLGVTYWATAHLSEQSGAKFVGYSAALANGFEAVVALMVGVRLIQNTHKLAVGASVACGFVAFLVASYPRLEFLWLERIGDGVLAAIATTSALGFVLAEARTKATGARLIIAFESIVIVAFALGSAVAAFLWPALGAATFVVSGGLYLTTAIAWRQRSSESKSSETELSFEIPRNPIFVGVLAMSTSASMWVSQIAFVMTSHKVAGQVFPGTLDKARVAILVVAYLAALSIGLALWSLLLPHVRMSVAAVLGACGAILASLALLVSNLAPLSTEIRNWAFATYGAALLVQTGLIPSMLASVNKSSAASNPISVSSAFVITTAAGSILGPLLGGVAASSASFSGLCLASVILAIVALISTFPGLVGDKPDPKRTYLSEPT